MLALLIHWYRRFLSLLQLHCTFSLRPTKKRERRRKKECAQNEDYHSSFRDNTLLECTRSQRIAQQDSSIFKASSVSLYFSPFFIAFFRWRGIRWSRGLIALSLKSICATFLSLRLIVKCENSLPQIHQFHWNCFDAFSKF